MAKLTIRRKGHARKAYTAKRGGKTIRVGKSQVKSSTFKISDRGKKGRGTKVAPPLEKGAQGGPGFFNRSNEDQEKIVFKRANKLGEKKWWASCVHCRYSSRRPTLSSQSARWS